MSTMIGQLRLSRLDWFRDLLSMAGLIVILGLAEWLGLANPMRQQLQAVAEPITWLTTFGLKAAGEPFVKLTAQYQAMDRVDELERALTQALARISELEQIERENDELRQRLGAQQRPLKTVIGTSIVSYGLPTVSVGESDGVRPGDPVLAADVLVGTIGAVSAHQATVTLLSNPQSKSLVVKTENGSEGLLVGDGKRVLLTEVSSDRVLVSGERIVTAGQAEFPANVFVGTVQQVISDQSAPVQTATVEQLTTFYDVSIVEILP